MMSTTVARSNYRDIRFDNEGNIGLGRLGRGSGWCTSCWRGYAQLISLHTSGCTILF